MFEEYLKDVHAKIYIGTDDDMPEAFEAWLDGIDVDDIMEWADLFGRIRYTDGKQFMVDEIKKLNLNIEE